MGMGNHTTTKEAKIYRITLRHEMMHVSGESRPKKLIMANSVWTNNNIESITIPSSFDQCQLDIRIEGRILFVITASGSAVCSLEAFSGGRWHVHYNGRSYSINVWYFVLLWKHWNKHCIDCELFKAVERTNSRYHYHINKDWHRKRWTRNQNVVLQNATQLYNN